MAVIVPAAGEGSRFKTAGYTVPKPLILARGIPMISRVLDMFPREKTLVIGREADAELLRIIRGTTVVPIRKLTEGAAITVLCAEGQVFDDEPVFVVNSDNLILGVHNFIDFVDATFCDGAMITFHVEGGPWSYAKERHGEIVEVREKQPISNLATAGVYYFRSWRILRNAICQMVAANDRYNGEFYLAPAYNYLIRSGMVVRNFTINAHDFISLGTPEDLERYNAGD
jgi:dTDP-glucose pyrophosphorylase